MNAPFVVAQANTTGSATGTRSLRTIKVQKPQGDQAVTVQLGYDQNYKLDLSLIANEKITLVHIGEKLIILFDNKSTVTVEPFFDSMNAPLSNVTVEANGRDFTGSEFASAFPITTDQSVLTAAGVAGFAGSPASGADFRGPSVDQLNDPNPLPLLGQEELPNFVITPQFGIAPPVTTTIAAVVENLPPNAAAGQAQANEKGLPGQEGEGFGLQVGSGEIADGDAFNDSDPSESTSGALSFSDPDGTAQVTEVNGTPVTADGTVIFGNFGFLTINLDGTFSYTLTQNDLNHSSQGTGSDGEAELFNYTVEDSSGATQSSTLTIDIIDDVPTARADTDTIAAGDVATDGNVFSGFGTNEGFGAAGADTEGADGATVTGVVAGTGATPVTDGSGLGGIAGNFGTLTLDANGSYVYTRAPGTPGDVTDVFTYTLTDGDGDTSTATLTINVENNGPDVSVPTLQDPGTQVNESGLPARAGEPEGTASASVSEVTSGTISFTSLDGVSSVEIAGLAVTPGSLPQTVVSDATGTLVITSFSFDSGTGTGSIDYTYTLTDNTLPDPSDVSFSVVVTDADGDAANGTLTIDIVDDAPVAVNDTDVLSNATNTATGNVITAADTTNSGADTLGADDALVSAIQGNNPGSSSLTVVGAGGVTISGEFGTLTIAQDGSYTYTRTFIGPLTATDAFTYTLEDGDGDASTATLTININDGGVTITNLTPEAGGGDATVNEDDLLASRGANESAGSDASKESTTQTGTFNISAPDGLDDLSVGGHAVITNGLFQGGSLLTPFGNTLTFTGFDPGTGVVSYTYTLLDNEAHANGGGVNNMFENFAVVLTDADGSSDTDMLSVRIIDDVPSATNHFATVQEGSSIGTVDVVFIVDISGSMAGFGAGVGFDVPGFSDDRIGLARYSMQQLLTNHSEILNVQFTKFSDGAISEVWMSRTDALTYINTNVNWGIGEFTNYDIALNSEMTAYNASSRPLGQADQTVVYFLSDGEPNRPSADPGITNNGAGSDVSIAEWEAFLNTPANDISNVFAIGIGSGVGSAQVSNLEPIAYPNTDVAAPVGDEDNVVIISSGDLGALTQTLDDLLVSVVSSSGNVLTDGVLTTAFGADGGHIHSIEINGTTYTWNGLTGASSVITETGTINGTINGATSITAATGLSGQLTFYFTAVSGHAAGDWAYSSPANVAANSHDLFPYVIVDNDGDTSDATLDITVTNLNQAPTITSNLGGATATVTLNENATAVTTVTSTDPDSTPGIYSIVGGSDAAKFTINTSTGVLSLVAALNFETPTDSNTNNSYVVQVQASDGALSDTQTITVTVQDINEQPSAGSDQIVGAAENVNTTTVLATVAGTDPDFGGGNDGANNFENLGYSIVAGNAAGLFEINSSGQISLVSGQQLNFETAQQHVLTVRVSDGPGLFDDVQVTVNVTNVNEVQAVADNLITNFGTNNAFTVPEWAFLANDFDPEGNALDISAASNVSGLSVSHTAGSGTNGTVNITDSNPGGGSFQYTATDGSASSTITITLTQDSNNITGDSDDEIMVGDGDGDTFTGNGGNDVILAGGGNDTLNGGAGNDYLVGGSGNDNFQWNTTSEFGDKITDFATASDNMVFDVGNSGSQIRIGDNDTNVENYREGNNSAINLSNTEIGVKTDVAVATASIQTTIDGYTNINNGAVFVFLDSTKGHAVAYYDANPSAVGGATLVAEFINITTLGQVTNFSSGDFQYT